MQYAQPYMHTTYMHTYATQFVYVCMPTNCEKIARNRLILQQTTIIN